MKWVKKQKKLKNQRKLRVKNQLSRRELIHTNGVDKTKNNFKVVYLQESGWMDSRQEKYMWRALKVLGANEIIGTSSMEKTLDQFKGYTRVFVENREYDHKTSLYEFKHPKNAIYIFGNNPSDNLKLATDKDEVIYVQVDGEDDIVWAYGIATAVLYDRRYKQWRLQ